MNEADYNGYAIEESGAQLVMREANSEITAS